MFALRRFGAVVLALTFVLAAAPVRAEEQPPVDKLLPNDTEMVFTIKPKAIFDSQLAKRHGVTDAAKQGLESIDEVQSILKELNFNPLTDLEQLTFAVCSGSDPDKGLVIFRGKFDIEKFRTKADEAAKDHKDVVTVHMSPDGMGGQHTVYEIAFPGSNQPLFVSLANKNIIVAGAAKDYVLDALDKVTGKKTTQLKNKDTAELLTRLDPKMAVAVAMPAKTLSDNPQMPAQAQEFLKKMTDVVLGVEIDKYVKVHVVVTAKKAADAMALNQSLTQGINTGTALLSLLANNEPGLQPVLDLLKSIRPKLKDRTIMVELEISGDTIEKLLKEIKP